MHFYQLIDIDYTVPPMATLESQSFHYGDGPVVLATYDFEGYMARKVFMDLMPEAVQMALGIKPKAN